MYYGHMEKTSSLPFTFDTVNELDALYLLQKETVGKCQQNGFSTCTLAPMFILFTASNLHFPICLPPAQKPLEHLEQDLEWELLGHSSLTLCQQPLWQPDGVYGPLLRVNILKTYE